MTNSTTSREAPISRCRSCNRAPQRVVMDCTACGLERVSELAIELGPAISRDQRARVAVDRQRVEAERSALAGAGVRGNLSPL